MHSVSWRSCDNGLYIHILLAAPRLGPSKRENCYRDANSSTLLFQRRKEGVSTSRPNQQVHAIPAPIKRNDGAA